MDDPRDFIDSDEGRDIDWDSHLDAREPFFAYALPCESCGRPVDGDRLPAVWDPALLIGPCCAFCLDFEFPDLPNCYPLLKSLDSCKSVEAVRELFTAHVKFCRACAGSELREAA
jgi:hypothetical protein